MGQIVVGLGTRAGLTGTAVAVMVLVGGTSAQASTPTPTSGAVVSASAASSLLDQSAKDAKDAKDKAAKQKAAKDKAVKDKAVKDKATLSPAQVAAQIAQADALTADLTRSNAAIAASATKLDRYAKQANTLLQQYSEARTAERTAVDEAARSVALYQSLSTQLGEDRRALGQWAYQAYAGGGGTLGDVSLLFEALGKDASEASDTAAQLSYLSDQRTWAFNKVEDHTALQQEAAVRAVEASTRAKELAAAAAEAKTKLDAAIAQQKSQLDATRALHAAQVTKVGPIAGLLLGSETEAGKAATARLRKAMIVPGVKADGSVKACSTNELEYPNGAIPAAGLCPLYADPTQSLRPGAAAAFNAMSLAYEKDTGSPICITDSYRSFAEQVSVKADRGKWAATPGRSEHGFGRAVDLCGGIQSFGSSAHLWMKQNAPLYGWFHPSWAEPDGSLPEPWHWEYAG
ncbi:D-alanyl-D-alanine carboxypeptidase family protein [Pedococcus soli]